LVFGSRQITQRQTRASKPRHHRRFINADDTGGCSFSKSVPDILPR
jgi:hypothetical protein